MGRPIGAIYNNFEKDNIKLSLCTYINGENIDDIKQMIDEELSKQDLDKISIKYICDLVKKSYPEYQIYFDYIYISKIVDNIKLDFRYFEKGDNLEIVFFYTTPSKCIKIVMNKDFSIEVKKDDKNSLMTLDDYIAILLAQKEFLILKNGKEFDYNLQLNEKTNQYYLELKKN